METTKQFYHAYKEARTRLQIVLDSIPEKELVKKLGDSPNSIGFLLQHIGDVELLFSKNVFKDDTVEVKAKTVIDRKDTGVWINLKEISAYLSDSFQSILVAIAQQDDDSWEDEVTTKEFGTKTKAEAFGRIISHTAYHAGQIAIIVKYGK
ncbi:MAG: DinB family protein [Flavobacteriales bacterium]|nr:DinB family protein [Flavobacteriales bacterium]